MASGTVAAIGYVGLDSADLAGWQRLATEVIGAEVGRGTTDDVLRLKLDGYEHRIAVQRAEREGLSYIGWEFAGDGDIDTTLERLARLGVRGMETDLDVAVARGVGRLVQIEGPDNVPLELFVGARREDTTPFKSPTDASFVAEGLGFGHVVLWTEDYDSTTRFYTEGLGLEVTDFIIQGPFRAGFLGCNARHHSIAVFSAPGVPPHLDHFMLEMTDLSMVGRAHDRCLQGLGDIAYTLGQHWNDRATSFYVRTPSGFNIELGWEAIKIDRASWVSHLGDGDISVWGHHARNADDARKLRSDSWVADLRLVTK